MSAYWVQFARSGNPNREGLPEWPRVEVDDAQTFEIGDEIAVQADLLRERMQFHIERATKILDKTSAEQ